MWFEPITDRLGARLRRLYRAAEPAPEDMSQGADALERRLLAEHAARYPGGEASGLRGFAAAHRGAFAALALGVATAGACQVPVDYEREFGASVECQLPRDSLPEGQVDAIARALEQGLGSERLALDVHDDGGPSLRFRVDLWGASVDDAGLIAALRDAAPQIPAGACTRTPLAATVHGTLGGRLGLRFFDVDLDREDAETARARIVEELAQQGLEGDAEIEIRDDGEGKREVEVRIRARGP